MPGLKPAILKPATVVALLLLATSVSAENPSRWAYDAKNDRIGRIYYYERTNTDGSMDERITVFRKNVTDIEVYKENGFCKRAALVSAELDLDTLSASSISGGALQPEAQHVDFAFLEYNEEQQQVALRVELPDMEIRDESEVRSMPWTLYDFDLASLTVTTPHIENREGGFSFGMALLWADPGVADPFYWMGDVHASYLGDEKRLGVASEHYRLTGSAFSGEKATASEGELWLDSEDGHIVDAVFPTPNHPGYTDFRLKLQRISDGGEAEWTTLLKAHFEGCS